MIHILLVAKPYIVCMKAVEKIQSLLAHLTQQELIIIAYQIFTIVYECFTIVFTVFAIADEWL